MPEYLSGSDQDRRVFHKTLEHLRSRHGLSVVGSVGRQAIYNTFAWKIPPLNVRQNNSHQEFDAMLRGIDIITPKRFISNADIILPNSNYREEKVEIDSACNFIFDDLIISGGARNIPSVSRFCLDDKVLRRVSRRLDGVDVYTLSVGAHLYIEQAMLGITTAEQKQDKDYATSHRQFWSFANSIRQSHPEEFLPETYYQPIRDMAAARVGRYCIPGPAS